MFVIVFERILDSQTCEPERRPMSNNLSSIQCTATKTKEKLVRETLIRVADKWTLLVIDELSDKEPKRFSHVMAGIQGISQRMLTKTLRALERDGMVFREIHMEIPPRVEYRLTALGMSLDEALCSIWQWADRNLTNVQAARQRFDSGEKVRGVD
jgi:DNA-binding HxlR family transcriptional regulator